LQPPHTPDGLGLSYIGLSLDQVLYVKAPKTADSLWSAEQILRAGSCGALVFWSQASVLVGGFVAALIPHRFDDPLSVFHPTSSSSTTALAGVDNVKQDGRFTDNHLGRSTGLIVGGYSAMFVAPSF
jgi:hypothetical protein